MNPKIKAKWVRALRSGEYTQVKGRLRKTNGFCCLGVLCEIAVEEGVIPAGSPTLLGEYAYGAAGCRGVLPPEVREWAELLEATPRAGSEGLAELNDNGVPFEKIADVIERHL